MSLPSVAEDNLLQASFLFLSLHILWIRDLFLSMIAVPAFVRHGSQFLEQTASHDADLEDALTTLEALSEFIDLGFPLTTVCDLRFEA